MQNLSLEMTVNNNDYDGGLHSMKRFDQAIFPQEVGNVYDDDVCFSAVRWLITP
jgi:hypothetical protein